MDALTDCQQTIPQDQSECTSHYDVDSPRRPFAQRCACHKVTSRSLSSGVVHQRITNLPHPSEIP
ncbi:hypothetical protein PILCRDRAFT_830311 [Piloderma croceum F 1598]|uniref:Uncharacterized protein n=1 Tax=Piloderma croceum (strain F 1598) TaxID=765440 RepID=A0A0C3B2J9_PILCF|nr:hypothetical protein PILCRDRAFT_830311 [Piloderma croceum F 1598]